MSHKQSLSATNLAAHHHLRCDLFLHNTYHGNFVLASSLNQPSELTKAQFERGNDWEATLFAWLDRNDLLLTVHSTSYNADDLRATIEFDDRDHFYIAGLSFWPPKDALDERFALAGKNPVTFGLFKPDLLEIQRTTDGSVIWRVIDAKASNAVKVRSLIMAIQRNRSYSSF